MTEKKSQVWGNHLNVAPKEANVLFCAGRDVQALPMADQTLLPYDIWTNRAHNIMLHRQKIIDSTTLTNILKGLADLEELVQKNEFTLDPRKEDVHINVEAFITERYGIDIGGRMHTGRSRNDQTACDMRLYLRDAGIRLAKDIYELIGTLLRVAKPHVQTVMPGFTHYQPAMITTWGHWLCAYVQGLNRDLERLLSGLQLVNRNPLGAAASFGTSWPIDRQLTTELLGFEKTDLNTLDCIVSRWENEAQLAQNYAFFMNHASIMAQDLIFLSLPYLKLIGIDESYVTGSSIMPQKKNPDFAEIIKAKASLVHGGVVSLMGIQKGGLSGYNRDTQQTKYLIMDIIRECEPVPTILRGVFETLRVYKETMRQQCQTGFMNAVDLADYLARSLNLSFRECYEVMALAVKLSEQQQRLSPSAIKKALRENGIEATLSDEELEPFSQPQIVLSHRKHQGAPSPDAVEQQIESMTAQSEGYFQSIEAFKNHVEQARKRCQDFVL
ncbi:argininosuccinate lyase [Deltaproteobacteria bacterium TL4]